MANESEYRSLPFAEAIEFFKQKVRLPTRRWDDIMRGMHARAFVVAGAQRDALLADIQQALTKALAQGTTIQEFRKDFDNIVTRNGWSYKGGRNWRTRVIYETNIRTAYQAGRYKQQTDPDVVRYRPFWRYVHSDWVRHPRKQHLAWHGLVLPVDDKFWKTHYPPNGWGCQCAVEALSRRDLEKLGKSGPDPSPETPIDPRTGAPAGIDKGWDYNVGEAAWGRSWAKESIERGPFTEIDPRTPADYPNLPAELVPEPAPADPLPARLAQPEQLLSALPAGIYADPTGARVNLNDALIRHWLEAPAQRLQGRQVYLPLLPHVIERPQEIWLGFMQAKDGKVELVRRYIAAYSFARGTRGIGLIADFIRGQWVALSAFPERRASGGRLRSGRLLWWRGGS